MVFWWEGVDKISLEGLSVALMWGRDIPEILNIHNSNAQHDCVSHIKLLQLARKQTLEALPSIHHNEVLFFLTIDLSKHVTS